MYAHITQADIRRGRKHRRSATACVLAQALRREYGGEWDVGLAGATWRDHGQEKSWRIGPSAWLVQLCFALHLPVPVRRVQLIPRPSRRVRMARAWGGGAASAGSLALVLAGFAWVVFAVLAAAVAALAVVISAQFRGQRQPAAVKRAVAPVPQRARWPHIPPSGVPARERIRA